MAFAVLSFSGWGEGSISASGGNGRQPGFIAGVPRGVAGTCQDALGCCRKQLPRYAGIYDNVHPDNTVSTAEHPHGVVAVCPQPSLGPPTCSASDKRAAANEVNLTSQFNLPISVKPSLISLCRGPNLCMSKLRVRPPLLLRGSCPLPPPNPTRPALVQPCSVHMIARTYTPTITLVVPNSA